MLIESTEREQMVKWGWIGTHDADNVENSPQRGLLIATDDYCPGLGKDKLLKNPKASPVRSLQEMANRFPVVNTKALGTVRHHSFRMGSSGRRYIAFWLACYIATIDLVDKP